MVFLAAQSEHRSLFTFTSGMFGTLASHPHLLIDNPVCPREPLSLPLPRFLSTSLPYSQHRTSTARYPPTGTATSTGRGYPRSAHLCARLQPLVHLVDPILRLDHVWRVSPVEGSERRRVERVVGWVRHGGSWRGARRDFNIQRARQRTWECDALRRPPVGSSRCRG